MAVPRTPQQAASRADRGILASYVLVLVLAVFGSGFLLVIRSGEGEKRDLEAARNELQCLLTFARDRMASEVARQADLRNEDTCRMLRSRVLASPRMAPLVDRQKFEVVVRTRLDWRGEPLIASTAFDQLPLATWQEYWDTKVPLPVLHISGPGLDDSLSRLAVAVENDDTRSSSSQYVRLLLVDLPALEHDLQKPHWIPGVGPSSPSGVPAQAIFEWDDAAGQPHGSGGPLLCATFDADAKTGFDGLLTAAHARDPIVVGVGAESRFLPHAHKVWPRIESERLEDAIKLVEAGIAQPPIALRLPGFDPQDNVRNLAWLLLSVITLKGLWMLWRVRILRHALASPTTAGAGGVRPKLTNPWGSVMGRPLSWRTFARAVAPAIPIAALIYAVRMVASTEFSASYTALMIGAGLMGLVYACIVYSVCT